MRKNWEDFRIFVALKCFLSCDDEEVFGVCAAVGVGAVDVLVHDEGD